MSRSKSYTQRYRLYSEYLHTPTSSVKKRSSKLWNICIQYSTIQTLVLPNLCGINASCCSYGVFAANSDSKISATGFKRASCMVPFSCIPFRGVDFLIKVVRMRRYRNEGWGCSMPFVKPKLRLYSSVERC